MTQRMIMGSRCRRAQVTTVCATLAFLLSLNACERDATDSEPAPPQLVSVTVTPDTQDIFTIGATAQLRATARSETGSEVRDADFGWSSSNTQVVTVNSDGWVTGVSSGSATVTATSAGVAGSASVWVDPERTLRNYCARCHAGGHTRTFAMVSCPACHGMVWEEPDRHWAISAGHATASGGFMLLGTHNLANCTSCHDLASGSTPFGAADHNDCIACHDPDYQGQHAGSGVPTLCSICHNTTAWSDASFDHESGGFALIGAHRQLLCTACHDPITGAPLYTPADESDCIACHDDDYQLRHGGSGYPTTCLTCHTVDAWGGANFDHDAQYFPIFSGKHANEWSGCTTCHTVPGDFAAFTCFTCHEHNQDDMIKEHDSVPGFKYESPQCLACHPNGQAP